MTYKVIYLTGAPAAGKSSTAAYLASHSHDVSVFSYGEVLTQHVQVANQEDLRRESATVITPKHVQEVDAKLFNFVRENRGTRHIIVDSHAVTKEVYGYRVIPFSLSDVAALAPDYVVMLFTTPEVTISRIMTDSGGRPVLTTHEAEMHTFLQGAVATTYSICVGRPLYIIDSSAATHAVAAQIRSLLDRTDDVSTR